MSIPVPAPELTVPLPQVMVFKCENSTRSKFRYLAAFEQKSRGDLVHSLHDNIFGLMSNVVDQWTGETAEEAKEKAILWWYDTFDLNKEIKRKGSALLGLVWVNRKADVKRARIKQDEVEAYLAQGYKLGKEFC